MSESVRFSLDTNSLDINDLCVNINRGKIRLPKYQRDFVWGTYQICALWDSIVKNISIGSVTIWETTNRLDDDRSIGGLILNPVDKFAELQYALDGQQRITCIYGTYSGITLGKIDFKRFYVDVSKNPNSYFPESSVYYIEDISTLSNKNDYFDLHSLLTNDLDARPEFDELFQSGLFRNLSAYGKIFDRFKLSTIITKGDNKNIARELFVRTNNTGKILTTYEILCAAIYSEEDHFYFSDRVSDFSKKFETFFSKKITTSEHEVLKLLSVLYCNNYMIDSVLAIDIALIIKDWSNIVESYSRMVDFVKENLNVSNLDSVQYKLSYGIIVKYFFLYPERVTHRQKELLTQLYWYLNMTAWIGNNSKSTIPKINNWLLDIHNEKTPDYDYSIMYSKDYFITASNFSTYATINKKERQIMLTYLQSLHPKSFYNGSEVKRDNMSEKNKVNFHHLFAVSVWKETSNQLGNIAFLDAQTNKIISNRIPSDYLPKFTSVDTLLESHCIDQTAYSYLLSDDFDKFTSYRIGKIYDNLIKLAKGL